MGGYLSESASERALGPFFFLFCPFFAHCFTLFFRAADLWQYSSSVRRKSSKSCLMMIWLSLSDNQNTFYHDNSQEYGTDSTFLPSRQANTRWPSTNPLQGVLQRRKPAYFNRRIHRAGIMGQPEGNGKGGY